MSEIVQERLAILRKWLILGYELHPMPELVKAIEAEKLRHDAILNDNQDEQLLIHCVKTGKPIGKLFAECADSHLNHAIAPNWLNTSSDTIADKLHTEPVALFVYTLMKLSFKSSKEFEKYVAQALELESVIEITKASHGIKSELYNSILAVLSAKETALLINAVSEMAEFAKYHNHIIPMFSDLIDVLCGFTSYENTLFQAIIERISDAYLPHLQGYLSRFVISELVDANETDFMLNLDAFATTASNRLAAPSYELTSAKLTLFSTANRKLMSRDQIETMTQVNIAFSDFLTDTLANDEVDPFKMGFTMQARKHNPVPSPIKATTTASEHFNIIQSILGL
jgi:hypothetical protein